MRETSNLIRRLQDLAMRLVTVRVPEIVMRADELTLPPADRETPEMLIAEAAGVINHIELYAHAREYDARYEGLWDNNPDYRQDVMARLATNVARGLLDRGAIIFTKHPVKSREGDHLPRFAVEAELFVLRPNAEGVRFTEELQAARRAGAEAMREAIKSRLADVKKTRGMNHWAEGLDYSIAAANVDAIVAPLDDRL